MAGFNDAGIVRHAAVPAVCLLISFLGYFSQFLFHTADTLDPGPPSTTETTIFNTLLVALWYTYYKAITTDPGRYIFKEKLIEVQGRWCTKCNAPKPPRAHHCRHCARCVPKMDHHCPWTKNCVSMTTFPHFYRFLCYCNASLWMLAYLIWQRFYAVWDTRNLPAYLGPSLAALISLALVGLICFFTSLALGLMLITTTKNWVFNQTMIESWEAERHEAIAERGGRDWWDVVGADGKKVRFERIEFPYDIGFLQNMSQAMGTSFFPLWLFPFAGAPQIDKSDTGLGWVWEENGFNRIEGMWPPPDPEKIRREARQWATTKRDFDAELRDLDGTAEEVKAAFRLRQEQDTKRRNNLVTELEEEDSSYEFGSGDDGNGDDDDDWVNEDGDRLRDFGVDDEDDIATTTAQDEDIPLGELIRRRKVAGAS